MYLTVIRVSPFGFLKPHNAIRVSETQIDRHRRRMGRKVLQYSQVDRTNLGLRGRSGSLQGTQRGGGEAVSADQGKASQTDRR